MTLPCPSTKSNGLPASQDASNCLPSNSAPRYCIERLSPDAAAAPLPTTMSFLTSLVGGSPEGAVIVGFFDVSLETLMLARLNGLPVVEGEVAVSVGVLAGIAGTRSAPPPPSAPRAPRPS